MDIGATIKEHPVGAIAIVGVAAIVLFMLLSSGGSSSTASDGTTADSGMQVAELQAATQMAGAQLAYKSNQDQLQSAQNIAALQVNSDLLKTYSNNDTTLKVAGVQAGVASKQIDAQTAMQLGQFKNAADLAAISAGVSLASISANKDTSIAQTTALADANKYVAALGASTTMQANQLAAQTEQLLSNNNASVANNKTNKDFWGNLIGGAASLLGFFL